ncbi:MAG TPA: hypothetical protein VGE01_12945 [Fimbriimonas sp.]
MMPPDEFERVPGVFVASPHHPGIHRIVRELDSKPGTQCYSVYDVGRSELVAMSNLPTFYFRDPHDVRTLLSSDELLSFIEPRDLGKRTAMLRKARDLDPEGSVEYAVTFHFPDAGPIRLHFQTSVLSFVGSADRLLISLVRFTRA